MKAYLGDGVYVDVDEYGDLVLTTENGISIQNRIVLEPAVLAELERYIQECRRAAQESGKKGICD